MRKFKFDAHIRIQNESLDIQFYLSGEINIDLDPGDAPGEPYDESDDPYDEPGWPDGEPDKNDDEDKNPDRLNWPSLKYN